MAFPLLRRLTKTLAADQGPPQLNVFGMSPHQRARRPRRFSREQLALRDIGCVPYLFGNEAACSCRIFHHAQQRLGGGGASSGKFVVGSFTGEQRPGATNSRAVGRRTVLVLPVSVAV